MADLIHDGLAQPEDAVRADLAAHGVPEPAREAYVASCERASFACSRTSTSASAACSGLIAFSPCLRTPHGVIIARRERTASGGKPMIDLSEIYFHDGREMLGSLIVDDLALHGVPPWAFEAYLDSLAPASFADAEPQVIPTKGGGYKVIPASGKPYYTDHPPGRLAKAAGAAASVAAGAAGASVDAGAAAGAVQGGMDSARGAAKAVGSGLASAYTHLVTNSPVQHLLGGPSPESLTRFGKSLIGLAQSPSRGGGGSGIVERAQRLVTGFCDSVRGSAANALHALSRAFAGGAGYAGAAMNALGFVTAQATKPVWAPLTRLGLPGLDGFAKAQKESLDRADEHKDRLSKEYGPTMANLIVGSGHLFQGAVGAGVTGAALAATYGAAFGGTLGAPAAVGVLGAAAAVAGLVKMAQHVPLAAYVSRLPGLAAAKVMRATGLGPKAPNAQMAAFAAAAGQLTPDMIPDLKKPISLSDWRDQSVKCWGDITMHGLAGMMSDKKTAKWFRLAGKACERDPETAKKWGEAIDADVLKNVKAPSRQAVFYQGAWVAPLLARADLAARGLRGADLDVAMAALFALEGDA